MKSILRFVLPAAMLVILTACGSSNSNEPAEEPDNNQSVEEPSNNNEGNNNSGTTNEENNASANGAENNTENNETTEDMNNNNEKSQEDIIQDIASQETTSFEFNLPKELPVDENKQLTGKTDSKENTFEITFYQTDEVIPPNDDQLEEEKEGKIAHLTIEAYDNTEKAAEAIDFENYADYGGEEVGLGHDITGYQDGAAGSIYTNWNEGRWALSTRAKTESSDEGVDLAKEAVDFLEQHTLPAPDEHGRVKLDTDPEGTSITWQDGELVYTIDQVPETMDVLKIASAF